MGATMVEKIARRHMTRGPDRPLRPGDMVSLRPRHILTHDNTAAVMAKFDALGADRMADPTQPVVVLDHDIQNMEPENVEKYRRIRDFCRHHGLAFHPAGTGIGHQVMMERGFALPGTLVVASDSHANSYGALGALGTPVVRTDAAAIWATGEFWWQVPRTVQVWLDGELPAGVSGKDLILTLCALYDQDEVLNAAVEFTGPGVASLDMADRMSVANMTTEWGALTGWFPVDFRTLDYLRERKERLECVHPDRMTDDELLAWRTAPPRPDPDADYAARITVDLTAVRPYLAGPDSVRLGRSVADAEPERIRIHKAYLLSCVNGRLEDLQTAAAVLKGGRVPEDVELYVAAASREIQDRAEASGVWRDLLEAGARPLPPGCGPCIGLGEGLLREGEVGISATNRNFSGRMGHRDARVYLASPAVVAASALTGYVTDGGLGAGAPARDLEVRAVPAPPDETVEIVDGFPARVAGRLVYIPRDALDTDGIYGKDHTYRALGREEMAAVVMANYDPSFAGRVREGDILVGGRSFGTGSSREQAATALQAGGIRLVIAASFSQTYLRNAYNNGLLCIEAPAFVDAVAGTLAGAVETSERTVIPGDEVVIDFRQSVIGWRDGRWRFPSLGAVPQTLVAAGGVEAVVRERLEVRES